MKKAVWKREREREKDSGSAERGSSHVVAAQHRPTPTAAEDGDDLRLLTNNHPSSLTSFSGIIRSPPST